MMLSKETDNHTATCLFTGETLNAETKIEHTILESLGGRITSKYVTSSEFNQQSSGQVDSAAKQIYGYIMSVLSPALPNWSRTMGPSIETPGHKGKYRLNKLGQLEIAGVHVERDISGKVQFILGSESKHEQIKDVAKQLGLPDKELTNSEIELNDVFFRNIASVNPFIEVCLLKCILLTFDHLLREAPYRFTRCPELQACRETVRDFVRHGNQRRQRISLGNISLGLQYAPEMRGRYESIMQKAGIEWEPFAHQLIVSGNPSSKILDAVFVVFGEDPHAFRLSEEWTGPSFTHVVANGIFANQSVSKTVTLREAWILGKPNFRKSFVQYDDISASETIKEKAIVAANEVAEHRMAIFHQAVEYPQINCDQFVIDQIARAANCPWNYSQRIDVAIFHRLICLFDGANLPDKKEDIFIEAIGPIIDSAGSDTISDDGPTPDQGWAYWLSIHRQCFSVLKEKLGWAGRIYVDNTRYEFSKPERLL